MSRATRTSGAAITDCLGDRRDREPAPRIRPLGRLLALWYPRRDLFYHTFYLDHWAPSLAGASGGPLATLLLAWLGVLLMSRPGTLELGAALAIVHASSRLLAHGLVAATNSIRINDEGVMAAYLGWPDWTFVVILAPLFVAALALAWRGLGGPRRRRAAFFSAVVLSLIVIGAVEIGLLEPLLFPEAARRELVLPGRP